MLFHDFTFTTYTSATQNSLYYNFLKYSNFLFLHSDLSYFKLPLMLQKPQLLLSYWISPPLPLPQMSTPKYQNISTCVTLSPFRTILAPLKPPSQLHFITLPFSFLLLHALLNSTLCRFFSSSTNTASPTNNN